MFRYVTPAKIGLLVVIELYVEEAVPNDAIVPVLDFLTSHILDAEDLPETSGLQCRWEKLDKTVEIVTSIMAFEQVLGPAFAANGLPGRRLWDRFLDKIWGINSLDAVYEFFDALPRLLSNTKQEPRIPEGQGRESSQGIRLQPNSPFGMFVRRCHLEFMRLPFQHSTALWKYLVKYRQPTAANLRRRNPQHSRFGFDQVLVDGQHDWQENTDTLAMAVYSDVMHDDRAPVSADDIESLLDFQTARLQKYGTRVPEEVANRFQRLLKDSLIIPSQTRYLRFLDAWKAGDYPTSFDYLHRYFDYSTQVRDRNFYQYALTNLAILHADFGCNKEAVDAILGAIATAGENRDMTCLNFALNWLFHFGRAHPHLVKNIQSGNMLGQGKESLSFLRSRARDTGMWILASSSLLSEVKMGLSEGESIATCLESMVRSSQVIVEHNTKVMFGTQMALTMTLWDRLGIAKLSSMVGEVYLRCHARHGLFDDELKVVCRLAGQLAGEGNYNAAFKKLESIEPQTRRNRKPTQYCLKYRGLLKLHRDLHRGDLNVAEHLLDQLQQSQLDNLEPDLAFVVNTIQVEVLIRRGDLETAASKVEALLASSKEEQKDVNLRIRLLLLKCEIFNQAGRPQKGFSLAMRAATLAWRARLLRLLWPAIGAVANVLTSLGEFAASEDLLLAVLPRSLECEAAFLTGSLYSLLADARMGLAGRADPGPSASRLTGVAREKMRRSKRVEYLKKAHGALDLALAQFAAVEDLEKQCEMLAKKATIMKTLGDRVLADENLAKLLMLQREAASGNS